MGFLAEVQKKYARRIIAGSNYEFIVDLDERGTFSCHVDDPKGKTIWEASTDDDSEGEFWPVTFGFMKHTKDLHGLEEYLKHLKLMPKNAKLVKG